MSASLVKKSFDKASESYHDRSHVQRAMASYLISMLPCNKREMVFEAGCGTGNLTELLLKNKIAKNLVINDISSAMLEKCLSLTTNIADTKVEMAPGDFMQIKADKRYDLVISNAMLQWCCDLHCALAHLKDLLKSGGELAFSSFGPDNFKEIRDLASIGLDYKGRDEIISILDSLGFKYTFKELLFKEYFKNCHELLSYLKHTGVTAINAKPLSFKALREFMAAYDRDFSCGQRVYITWHQYFIYATL